MSKKKKTHVKTSFFVRGAGDFPIDMLRYDDCVPASSSDAALIQGDWGGSPARFVRLERFSEDGSDPTAARWRSFGWGCYSEAEFAAETTRIAREA